MTPLIHPASPRLAHLWRESPLGPFLVQSLCGKPFKGASSFRSVLRAPGPKAKPCKECQKIEEAT